MTKMIDKVAKAIFDEMDLSDSLALPEAERYARAAIEAMKDPTKTMVDAAYRADDSGMPLSMGYEEVWGHMITAALSEEKAE